MKQKLFFMLFLLAFSLNLSAQVAKPSVRNSNNRSKNSSTTVKVKTDEQLAIEKSQLWFKEKYVESTFKDPYSYRLVGIKAVPITKRESLDKQIIKVKSRMDACKVHPSERTESFLAHCKEEIEKHDEEMAELRKKTDGLSVDLYNISAKYRQKWVDGAEEIEKYLINEKEYNQLLATRNIMTEDQLNSFAYFEIHLDCYSKNDFGNEVLGRFVFPFTKDGVFVDDETTLLLLKKIN